ncbi:hypothetical protein AB0D49_12370 [Streptomyces sp. NPDC048290]|uniref:hypothetical protein n=1 Tax=Streptomyces sp. NPDC048290 TaxID=3155811 RepID=UPI003424A334
MRKRVTLGVVIGALALSGLAVPAAQADGSSTSHGTSAEQLLRAAHAENSAKSSYRAAAEGELDVSFSNFKIAKAIKVGTATKTSTTVTYKLTHAAGIDVTSPDFDTFPYLYRGAFETSTLWLFGDDSATCTVTSATTADCKGKIDIYPSEELRNVDAGTWRGAAMAWDFGGSGDFADQGSLGTTLVQRNSTLTVNATPEPVKKGKTITVTGKLSRANWETGKYAGYSSQSVKLQFRKKNATSYTTVKTIKTNSKGELKTTVKASQDGYFRYSYAGNTATPAVNAAGDYIDVR